MDISAHISLLLSIERFNVALKKLMFVRERSSRILSVALRSAATLPASMTDQDREGEAVLIFPTHLFPDNYTLVCM